MKKSNHNIVKFFSYIMDDTEKMMAAIFGRKKIFHEGATLQGYELCIQTAKDITDQVSPTCPFPVSPRTILIKKRGPEFELYTIRPNPKKIYGEQFSMSARKSMNIFAIMNSLNAGCLKT